MGVTNFFRWYNCDLKCLTDTHSKTMNIIFILTCATISKMNSLNFYFFFWYYKLIFKYYNLILIKNYQITSQITANLYSSQNWMGNACFPILSPILDVSLFNSH